jgi:hypothetical protein
MLELVFSGTQAITPLEFWTSVSESLRRFELLEAQYCYNHSERPIRSSAIAELARTHERRRPWSVNGDTSEVALVPFVSFEITVGYVRAPGLDVSKAEGVVTALSSSEAFLNARLCDDDYEYWQNNSSLDDYHRADRSTAGLTIGHDPVFNEDVVITSANPGRTVWHRGYKEGIAHAMWLSERFWQLGLGDKAGVLALGNVDSVQWLTRILVQEQAFLEDVALQKRIRTAVFGVE